MGRAADRSLWERALRAGSHRRAGDRTVAARVAAPRRGPLVVIAIVTVLALSTICGKASALPVFPLGHAGRWITDADGRVVILHGTNMVYKLPPYYPSAAGFGAEDAAFLDAIGMNAVRVGVIWKALEPEPGLFNEAYVDHIEETVEMLGSHGIASLIDMHQDMYNEGFEGEGAPDWAVEAEGLTDPHDGFPGNYLFNPALGAAMENFWDNSPGPDGIGLQEYWAGAWRYLADHLANLASILGFELWNEPFPGRKEASLHCATIRGCPKFDALLSDDYERTAQAIREVDPVTTIYYEPNIAFDFGFPTHTMALKSGEGNTGFSFHDYCPTRQEPEGCASEERSIENAVAHVRKTREALLMTEFGATNVAGRLEHLLSLAEASMVPWLDWAFCTCGDPTGNADEGLVKDLSAPLTGENIEAGTLHALVEPYPQVVAGIPELWHFNRSTRRFTFTYDTEKARGGDFRRGAVTEIAVPREAYPSGYTANAKGATIISALGAPAVELAQTGKAEQVSVTIEPQ